MSDHLHVRGEHEVMSEHEIVERGPPPRAWRALGLDPQHGCQRRTTSTCVESTRLSCVPATGRTDHLHVRGEHERFRR